MNLPLWLTVGYASLVLFASAHISWRTRKMIAAWRVRSCELLEQQLVALTVFRDRNPGDPRIAELLMETHRALGVLRSELP